MATPKWTYMLRLLRKSPDKIRMDRLADYMREFAKLLGTENGPVFRGIRNASTGITAAIPTNRQKAAFIRIRAAHDQPDSGPAAALRSIEALMGDDSIKRAQLRTPRGRVIYTLTAPAANDADVERVRQDGEVDGTITGIVGADDTMHLHVRDDLDRDLKLVVRSEDLARALLAHFRRGAVRLAVHGVWIRTDHGWIPEANRCTVSSFELLQEDAPLDILGAIGNLSGNGWAGLPDPDAAWRDLRGVQ